MSEKNDLISSFIKLGSSPKHASIAFQVYLELCEIKKYWDINYSIDCSTSRIYLTAKKQKSDPSSIFIPVHANESLPFSILQKYSINNSSVYLVVVSSDLTCVYYEISQGLVEPTDTTAKHLRTDKQEMLDAQIRRHRKLLEQSALLGIPVTIPTSKSSNG